MAGGIERAAEAVATNIETLPRFGHQSLYLRPPSDGQNGQFTLCARKSNYRFLYLPNGAICLLDPKKGFNPDEPSNIFYSWEAVRKHMYTFFLLGYHSLDEFPTVENLKDVLAALTPPVKFVGSP